MTILDFLRQLAEVSEHDELAQNCEQAIEDITYMQRCLANDRTIVRELIQHIMAHEKRDDWPRIVVECYGLILSELMTPKPEKAPDHVHRCPNCRRDTPCTVESCVAPLETAEGIPMAYRTCSECLVEMSKGVNEGIIGTSSPPTKALSGR